MHGSTKDASSKAEVIYFPLMQAHAGRHDETRTPEGLPYFVVEKLLRHFVYFLPVPKQKKAAFFPSFLFQRRGEEGSLVLGKNNTTIAKTP